MDIKFSTGGSLRTDGPATGGKPRGTPSPADAPLTGPKSTLSESVTLTATAKTLSAARGDAQETPIDNVHVAEIKSALAEGRYEINDQRLAQRMLAFEEALS